MHKKKYVTLLILLSTFSTSFFSGGKIFGLFSLAFLPDSQSKGEATVLTAEDVVDIKGGGSSSGGGLFKTTITPAANNKIDIQLSNVPYVYQENDYPIAGQANRSDAYCGLASALMVRTKEQYGTMAFSGDHALDYSWMDTIDRWLNSNTGSRHINIYPAGLVFVGSGYTDSERYANTRSILQEIYLTNDDDNWSFYHYKNTGRVSSMSFQLTEPDTAMNTIWNHVNNNKQPVVVISDSNLLAYYFDGGPYPKDSTPRTLHYLVIAGIRNKNGYKEYYILDPLRTHRMRYYKEEELKDMTTLWMSRYASIPQDQWVFDYTSNTGDRSSYIMLVYGN